jgi:hypothetical protein
MISRMVGLIGFLTLLWVSGQLLAQETVYQGKSIRIAVGLSASVGYDVYTRTAAKPYRELPNVRIPLKSFTGSAHVLKSAQTF